MDRPTRTGARGGSRTGHKSTHFSKSAGTNGTKSSSKQLSHKGQQDPSKPRFSVTDISAGVPRESMPDPCLSYKTSPMSSYRLGKSIPVVIHSGHDKILRFADHVQKLSLKSNTPRQIVSCESMGGKLNMPSEEDPPPRSSEKSKYDENFPAKRMNGKQNHGILKETINIKVGNKKTGVMEDNREYLVKDGSSGLAIAAQENGNNTELASSGNYISGQSTELQHYSRRQSNPSGFLDTYGHPAHSDCASVCSGKWMNQDWVDSESGLISDLCDIVRDGIMESGMKDMECFLKTGLTPTMKALVNRVRTEPRIILNPEWNTDTRRHASGSSAAASTKSAASTNNSNGDPSSLTSARSSLFTSGSFPENERDEGSSDDDEEKPPKGPKGPETVSGEVEIGARLACPFQKHDPKKYIPPDYKACASLGWDSISRVK